MLFSAGRKFAPGWDQKPQEDTYQAPTPSSRDHQGSAPISGNSTQQPSWNQSQSWSGNQHNAPRPSGPTPAQVKPEPPMDRSGAGYGGGQYGSSAAGRDYPVKSEARDQEGGNYNNKSFGSTSTEYNVPETKQYGVTPDLNTSYTRDKAGPNAGQSAQPSYNQGGRGGYGSTPQGGYGSATQASQGGYGSTTQTSQGGYGSTSQTSQSGHRSTSQTSQGGYGSGSQSSQVGYGSTAQGSQSGYGQTSQSGYNSGTQATQGGYGGKTSGYGSESQPTPTGYSAVPQSGYSASSQAPQTGYNVGSKAAPTPPTGYDTASQPASGYSAQGAYNQSSQMGSRYPAPTSVDATKTGYGGASSTGYPADNKSSYPAPPTGATQGAASYSQTSGYQSGGSASYGGYGAQSQTTYSQPQSAGMYGKSDTSKPEDSYSKPTPTDYSSTSYGHQSSAHSGGYGSGYGDNKKYGEVDTQEAMDYKQTPAQSYSQTQQYGKIFLSIHL